MEDPRFMEGGVVQIPGWGRGGGGAYLTLTWVHRLPSRLTFMNMQQWRIQDLVEGGAWIVINKGVVRGTKWRAGGWSENGNQEMLRGLLKHTNIRILYGYIVYKYCSQPRWLSGQRRSHVHSLMIARRSLCPDKLGSNPGQGSKGINFSGWHGLDMSITVTKRR